MEMSAKEVPLSAAPPGFERSGGASATALNRREHERVSALDGYFLLDTTHEPVYDAITQLAASICDAPIALISLIDRDRQWIKSRHGLPGVDEIPRASALCAQAILQDELMEIEDAAQDARFRTNPLVAGESGIRFYAGMPLINADGYALGTLCVIDRAPRRLTQAQRAALQRLSQVVISLFELRKSDALVAQLAGILDKTSNEIFIVDPKTLRFLHASESAQRNLQYTLDELKHLTPFDLVVGFTREQIDKAITPLRTGAPHVTAHVNLRRKDGSQYPVEARLQRSDRNGTSMFFAIANDITARRRNRERIAHLSRARTVLAECSRALAHIRDERQLLEQLCRVAAGTRGYSMAWIGMVEKDDERSTLIPVAHAGYDQNDLDSIRAGWHDGAQGGPVSDAVRSGRTCITQNIMDDPACAPWRDAAARLGFASCIALPLTDRADCIGCLVIYADEPFAFDGGEIALLEDLAVDIAHAICASRLRVARLQAEGNGGKTEQRFRATFNQAAVGITHTTLEGQFLRVNRKFCAMLGYEETELYSLAPGALTHPDDRFRHKQDKARLLAGKSETFLNEKRYVRKDGTVLWVRVNMSLVRDSDGKPEYFLGVVEDMTERKDVADALQRSEARYRMLFEASPIPMWVHESGTFRILAVNDAAVKLYGYSRDEFLAAVASIVEPEDLRSKPIEYWHADDQAVSVRRRTHQTKYGHVLEAEITTSPFDFNGQRARLVVINDITEQQRAERALRESEEQFQQLANNIPQMCWITDASQRQVVYLSPAFEAITGHTAEEAKANSRLLVKIVHPDDRRRIQVARKNAAIGGYDEIFRLVRPDGSIRWMHDRAFPIRDAGGLVYRVAGIAEDITERKHAEERMLHLAHYDALTSLPNRVLCYDRLKQALAQARRNSWSVAVMFVDLDRFKNVNDTLGHAIGDTLLQQASERLSRCIRSGDTVGRYGGDEFIVILSNLDGAQDTTVVARKITEAFAAPFTLNGSQAYVTASIGIALYPGDSGDQDELVRDADTAMYRAKELGRNNFQFYRASMNERARDKLALENDLRGALERHEFRLFYQPKVSLGSGEITGFEALIRWQHPERGLVSPLEFVPLLEETGLIVPAGEWVIRAACAQIRAWRDAGIQPAPVAVNLSARQFQSPDLGTVIVAMLDEFKLEPKMLELEITESSLMHNTEEAVLTLKNLEALGLRISIDDFGTGYSSLAYLKRFPLHALKIDRAFVKDIGQDSDDTAITLALISMAHNLGLKVIAEGVETEEQLTFLSANGCDEIQGYLFAEPLAAGACTEFLRQKKRLPRLTQRRDTQPASILLVDDDEDALLLLKRMLSSNDYEILIATSARQALRMLSEHNVKVVVSDQQMPGMSGVDFLQRVKSLFPDTVRVMLSGHTEFNTVSDAINKGEIFRFLAKSWDKEQLRRDIREAFDVAISGRGKLISIKGGRPTAA